jgi:hypothetical protein
MRLRDADVKQGSGNMDKTHDMVRDIGVALIVFAIAFNLPYAWLALNFHYPTILRQPPGEILEAFDNGGPALILAWACFALMALLLAPLAIAVARVTAAPAGITALGVAAGVTQAIGMAHWVYVVPGLSDSWQAADGGGRAGIEAIFMTLNQFAGTGIGEAIGQTLAGFWLIGVASSQRRDPRYGAALAWLGIAGGAILLLGLVEGLSTVLDFDPGIFSFAAMAGFLLQTIWLIWTGLCCLRRAHV